MFYNYYYSITTISTLECSGENMILKFDVGTGLEEIRGYAKFI